GVADSNPPNKVDDRESPANRDVHAPYPDAAHEEITNRVQQAHRDKKSNSKTDKPSVRSRSSDHDRADLVRDRAKRVPRLDHGSLLIDQFLSWIIHGNSLSY